MSKEMFSANTDVDATSLKAIRAPFDSSDWEQSAEGLPLYCLSWYTVMAAMHETRALVWVKGQPVHSFRNRWTGKEYLDSINQLWNFRLIQELSADVLMLRLFDLRRSAASVLLRFADARGLTFDEILRIESWGTAPPTNGIIDASFWSKSSTSEKQLEHHVILSFDFTHKTDEEALPRLTLLSPFSLFKRPDKPASSLAATSAPVLPRIVFVIASFGRKDHLQRLLRQINKLERMDRGRTSACIAGQSNDPEDLSLREQVARAATFSHVKIVTSETDDPFNKAQNLQNCLDKLDPNDIAFIMDVDLKLPEDLSEKARRYTRQGALVYAPIIWYQPNPDLDSSAHSSFEEKLEWKKLAPLGPGIIAFYVSDGRNAGGFDTKSFVEHGFEDTDFFFRLKRVPGLNVARVVERDLVHIYHKPSLNKVKAQYRLSFDDRWRNLQREKCPSVTQSRPMLEAYDESNGVAYPGRTFFIQPKAWTFLKRFELDVARGTLVRENVAPMPPLTAYRGHDVLEREGVRNVRKRSHGGGENTEAAAKPSASSLFQKQSRCIDGGGAITSRGGSFCIQLQTHSAISRNTQRLRSACLVGAARIIYRSAQTAHASFSTWQNDKDLVQALVRGSTAAANAPTKRTFNASLRHPAIGAFTEIGALFSAKIRCGEPFSLVLFAEHEQSQLQRYGGKSITHRCGLNKEHADNTCGNLCNVDEDCAAPLEKCFGSISTEACSLRAIGGKGDSMNGKNANPVPAVYAAWVADAFTLAAEYDGLHIGLPFSPCAEAKYGYGGYDRDGGGGNESMLSAFMQHMDPRIPPRQFVYSNLWRNALVATALARFLETVKASSAPCILVCDETLLKGHPRVRKKLPAWIWGVLRVPVWSGGEASRLKSAAEAFAEIHESGVALAKKASHGFVFLFASQLSGALVTMMTRSNNANTYVDVGKEGFEKIVGSQEPMAALEGFTANQRCTQTRWELVKTIPTGSLAQCPFEKIDKIDKR
jgi:hypothetical protein